MLVYLLMKNKGKHQFHSSLIRTNKEITLASLIMVI
jgi:hypothetical protein